MSEEKIEVQKVDNVYVRILADPSILAEMSEHFTFYVPGAHYTPQFKNKMWDGKIRLFNRRNNTIYCGLIRHIRNFAKDNGYLIEETGIDKPEKVDTQYIENFIANLKLPHKLRSYQKQSFLYSIMCKRSLIVSPTASGKSLIIYLLVRWFLEHSAPEEKSLIVVPTTSLVEQLYKDFQDYSKNTTDFLVDEMTHKIYYGHEKETNKRIVISTWQSLYKKSQSYFNCFKFVLVDECHLAKAASLKDILTKSTEAYFRFGTTGTLQNTKCHELVIEGLTGPIFHATTTKELMDTKKLANLKIKCLVFKYSEVECRDAKKLTYNEEVDFLVQHKKRNYYIENLALSLKGNTLILFRLVKKHGYYIYAELQDLVKNTNECKTNIFFVAGQTKTEDREKIREIVETENNAIIVASVGVFSTGINIKNLENIIFASPTKSKIRTLQSIGRVLRIGRSDQATLYDIVDDLSWKQHKNFALKHFIERTEIYNQEKFEYSLHEINIR